MELGVLKKLHILLSGRFVYADTSPYDLHTFFFCLTRKSFAKKKKKKGLNFEEPVSNTQLNLSNSIHNRCLSQLKQLQLIPV